jgi:hypothetical protein
MFMIDIHRNPRDVKVGGCSHRRSGGGTTFGPFVLIRHIRVHPVKHFKKNAFK